MSAKQKFYSAIAKNLPGKYKKIDTETKRNCPNVILTRNNGELVNILVKAGNTNNFYFQYHTMDNQTGELYKSWLDTKDLNYYVVYKRNVFYFFDAKEVLEFINTVDEGKISSMPEDNDKTSIVHSYNKEVIRHLIKYELKDN